MLGFLALKTGFLATGFLAAALVMATSSDFELIRTNVGERRSPDIGVRRSKSESVEPVISSESGPL
jgi:hypothetical protein